jgi:hypothetical protein
MSADPADPEVTPEMIDAGVDVVLDNLGSQIADLLPDVYLAMWRVGQRKTTKRKVRQRSVH